ncbi:MAG: DNA polymerase Y family protein [Burkholderiales bacterium]|nr:DNA polymerase Y family protein [Burkholderiales bacterium]
MHWIALRPTSDDAAEAPLADASTAWAWWALQFTPLVARMEDALLLEVSASVRLFGGLPVLLDQLLKPNWAPALVQSAQGATSLIAFGRLQCAGRGATSVDSLPADALPLPTLAAARAHLPTLARLGLRTWGQLRALPRGGLVRRFGAGLLDALDCAYGQRPEVYPWLTLPDVFDAPLELLSSVESAPALLFGARRLLAQLQVWLRARQRGVLALELLWELDARRSNALHVDAHHHGGSQGRLELRTAQPTQDMGHLARLLAEQLARVTLPAPVLHLRMRSLQTEGLAGESVSLLPEDVRHGDSLHQLLERLSARLGPGQVRSVQLQADHRPEHMQHWGAAVESAIKSGASHALSTRARGPIDHKAQGQGAVYPTWLLATPQRLNVHQGCPHYQGPLTLLLGPQRLEAGWLEGAAALRDYYVARSSSAGLVWVYCDRLGQLGADTVHWYLHGVFA